MRSVALDDDELLGAGNEGRDFEVIEIEALARERTAAGSAAKRLVGQSLTHHRFRRMLLNVADNRAARLLDRMLSDNRRLTDLMAVDPDSSLEADGQRAFEVLKDRIVSKVGDDVRYSDWLEGIERLEGRDGLARLAEIEVLIERDARRIQDELFVDYRLGPEDAVRRGSPALKEAAFLRVAGQFGIPYYFGPEIFARLGSANIEQFLELCGDVTARLITQDATGRPLGLPAALQDRIVREASHVYYQGLRQLPDGDLIQRFVDAIGRLSQVEGAKPTIPYPPGVTGTAISMADRTRLRTPLGHEISGAKELRLALVSAIAHNVVWIELDYSVKNNRWMVIYLNRLLCPMFDMPLGLGGFRERKLAQMAAWMVSGGILPIATQEALL
jgi:hypothetical protein